MSFMLLYHSIAYPTINGDEDGNTFATEGRRLTNHLAEIHSSWHMKETDNDDDDDRPRKHPTHDRYTAY